MIKESCHTCGGELAPGGGESPFCPHCGTPQLFLSIDYQSPETGGEQPEGTAGVASTGAMPPPRPQQVDWKMAIQCALAVAGVAGVLSVLAMRVPVLTPASVLWAMSASLITLGLYQRRRPAARMDAGVGARVGVMVGLCLAVTLAAALAVAGVVARFGLHAMGSFDAQLAMVFANFIQQSKGAFTPEELQSIQTQEFRAAYILLTAVIISGFLMVVSTVGGAFAGLMRTRRKVAV